MTASDTCGHLRLFGLSFCLSVITDRKPSLVKGMIHRRSQPRYCRVGSHMHGGMIVVRARMETRTKSSRKKDDGDAPFCTRTTRSSGICKFPYHDWKQTPNKSTCHLPSDWNGLTHCQSNARSARLHGEGLCRAKRQTNLSDFSSAPIPTSPNIRDNS
jgi:hypothetical protein